MLSLQRTITLLPAFLSSSSQLLDGRSSSRGSDILFGHLCAFHAYTDLQAGTHMYIKSLQNGLLLNIDVTFGVVSGLLLKDGFLSFNCLLVLLKLPWYCIER